MTSYIKYINRLDVEAPFACMNDCALPLATGLAFVPNINNIFWILRLLQQLLHPHPQPAPLTSTSYNQNPSFFVKGLQPRRLHVTNQVDVDVYRRLAPQRSEPLPGADSYFQVSATLWFTNPSSRVMMFHQHVCCTSYSARTRANCGWHCACALVSGSRDWSTQRPSNKYTNYWTQILHVSSHTGPLCRFWGCEATCLCRRASANGASSTVQRNSCLPPLQSTTWAKPCRCFSTTRFVT